MNEKLKQANNWEEQYRLIIQAGKQLHQPTAHELSNMQSITGCETKVWFQSLKKDNGTFDFYAYSEARIINGLLWILLQEINGKTAKQLNSFSITDYFNELGIAQRLSSTRLNGFKQIEHLIQTLP